MAWEGVASATSAAASSGSKQKIAGRMCWISGRRIGSSGNNHRDTEKTKTEKKENKKKVTLFLFYSSLGLCLLCVLCVSVVSSSVHQHLRQRLHPAGAVHAG